MVTKNTEATFVSARLPQSAKVEPSHNRLPYSSAVLASLGGSAVNPARFFGPSVAALVYHREVSNIY